MTAFTAGERLRAPDVRARFPLTVYATADITLTSDTALTDAIGLGVFLAAHSSYAIEGYIAYNTTHLTDAKFGLRGPSASTGHWGMLPVVAGAASTSGNVEGLRKVEFSDVAEQGATGYNAITPTMWCQPHGYIATVHAGVLQVRFAQAAAGADATTIKAGSWLRVLKLT